MLHAAEWHKLWKHWKRQVKWNAVFRTLQREFICTCGKCKHHETHGSFGATVLSQPARSLQCFITHCVEQQLHMCKWCQWTHTHSISVTACEYTRIVHLLPRQENKGRNTHICSEWTFALTMDVTRPNSSYARFPCTVALLKKLTHGKQHKTTFSKFFFFSKVQQCRTMIPTSPIWNAIMASFSELIVTNAAHERGSTLSLAADRKSGTKY